MASLDGDFTELASFAAKLNAVADGRTKRARAVKRRATTLLDEGYGNRRDPYGKKWRRRQRAYPWPLLEETGGTRGTLKVSASAGELVMSVSRFGPFHQPTRGIIPDGRGLPPRWTADFAKIVEQQLFDELR